MDDDIHTVHRADKPLAVAHIADKIAQRGMVESLHAHFMLFQLVAAEDDDFPRLFFLEQGLRELLAEGTCSTSDEHNLIFPVHKCSNFYFLITINGYCPFSPKKRGKVSSSQKTIRKKALPPNCGRTNQRIKRGLKLRHG